MLVELLKAAAGGRAAGSAGTWFWGLCSSSWQGEARRGEVAEGLGCWWELEPGAMATLDRGCHGNPPYHSLLL